MKPVILDPQPFAALLRTYVHRAGMSWHRLAARAFVNHSYLLRLAAGARTPPSRSVVLAIARGLTLADDEADALLGAAGWTVAEDVPPRVNIAKDFPRRPVVRCAECGHEWRGHAGKQFVCSVCERRELVERALRIEQFVMPAVRPKPVVVVRRPPVRRARKILELPRLPVQNGTYCRGCRRVFEEKVLVRMHLDGYYCRSCHQRKIDRLCGLAEPTTGAAAHANGARG